MSLQKINKLKQLRRNSSHLDDTVLTECTDTIYQSYSTSSIASKISAVSYLENYDQGPNLKSIGLRHLINLAEFNDRTYIWKPYFADVARAVANGEKKYLQDEILSRIKPSKTPIQETRPDFSPLRQEIGVLLDRNIKADTLLAPVYMLPSIYKDLGDQMRFISGEPEVLEIGNVRLRVFWSNKYAPNDYFIVFKANAGRWVFAIDPDTKKSPLVAIGEPPNKPGWVEYWVETLSDYRILDTTAYATIPVDRIGI